jgi:hypothetical protein
LLFVVRRRRRPGRPLCYYVARFQLMLLYVTVIAPAKLLSLSLSLSLFLSFFFGVVRSSSSLFGLAYEGNNIVFRFNIEYSSLMDFGPYVINYGNFLIHTFFG